MSKFMTKFAEACSMAYNAPAGVPLLKFVTKGDRKALETAAKMARNSMLPYWPDLLHYLAAC
jgi:hypothetical protein